MQCTNQFCINNFEKVVRTKKNCIIMMIMPGIQKQLKLYYMQN